MPLFFVVEKDRLFFPKKNLKTLLIAGLLLLLAAAGFAQQPNALSEQEKKEGWRLLFNGRDFSGWHTYGGKGTGPAWQIDSGAMHLHVPKRVGVKAPGGGDLVTDAAVSGDFELKLDWKVEKFTNSGVFLFVQETPAYGNTHETGLEIQLQDDAIYNGPPNRKHHTGNLFGVADTGGRTLRPVGQYNTLRVLFRQNELRIWINDSLVQQHTLTSADWKQRLAESPLAQAPLAKGRFTGRIGLQDWGSGVWFRNIKIRKP